MLAGWMVDGILEPFLGSASVDRYGLIGVAFSIQSWLLAAAFVVVVGGGDRCRGEREASARVAVRA